MFDNGATAQDVLEILQATLTTEEILKMKDKIFEINSHPYIRLNPLAHYVACLIEERQDNATLAPRPFIIEWDETDGDYYVIEECTEENKQKRMEYWQETHPYDDVDILYLTRP